MMTSAQERPRAVTVTLLVDNTAGRGLMSEHGFAAWVELPERRLLFDTAQGAAFEANAEALGFDLSTVGVLVLSHGHYDHTGGVRLVVERARGVEVYVHPAATGPRFSIRQGVAKPVAMPAASRSALEARGTTVRWTTEPVQLTDDAGLSGPIPRITDYEDTGGPFFIDIGGRQCDPIRDELALWVRTDRGLLVIVGCCHAGLVNTLHHAVELSGERRLRAVIGGFHLNEASEARLVHTVAELQALDPELIVPCHCTGDFAVRRLEQTLGKRVVRGEAGAVFRFDLARAPDRDEKEG